MLAAVIAALVFPSLCNGQGQAYTVKARLADFTTKTTKVVLGNNRMLDAELTSEIKSRWHLSPYEFCTRSEFESQKTDPSFYFLLISENGHDDVLYLTLKKGGTSSGAGLDASFDVISVPIASKKNPSGREYTYLPAFIDIIQNFVQKATIHEGAGYLKLSSGNFTNALKESRRIVLRDDDLGTGIDPELLRACNRGKFSLCTSDEADEIFANSEEGTIVSLTIRPAFPKKNSTCHLMLISADTHDLCWYRDRKLKDFASAGFTASEIKYIIKKSGQKKNAD